MDLAEDTLPSHDYVSIAAEFDDGQDLTYYWSAALPEGHVLPMPDPHLASRETHVVVRSGRDGLALAREERDLHADYRRIHRRPGPRGPSRLAHRQQPVPAWPRPL